MEKMPRKLKKKKKNEIDIGRKSENENREWGGGV